MNRHSPSNERRIRVYATAKVGPPPRALSRIVSKSMKSNRRSGTKPELLLARLLRMKITHSRLPGSPDFVYRRAKLAVFVHGCFWHRCPVHGKTLPKTHAAFWRRKFERNVERDRLNREELEAIGWRVLVVWEHELREDPRRCARRVKKTLERLRRTDAVGGRIRGRVL